MGGVAVFKMDQSHDGGGTVVEDDVVKDRIKAA
jgi:hypothetical protein